MTPEMVSFWTVLILNWLWFDLVLNWIWFNWYNQRASSKIGPMSNFAKFQEETGPQFLE